MYKYLGRGDVRKIETDCSVTSERTRDNRHKLKYEKFHLKQTNKKNPIVIARVIESLSLLSRETAVSLSLGVFNT